MKSTFILFFVMLSVSIYPLVIAIGENVVECVPFETVCIGEVLMTCNANGMSFKITDVCDYGCASVITGIGATCMPPPWVIYSLLIVFFITGLAFLASVLRGEIPKFMHFFMRKYL